MFGEIKKRTVLRLTKGSKLTLSHRLKIKKMIKNLTIILMLIFVCCRNSNSKFSNSTDIQSSKIQTSDINVNKDSIFEPIEPTSCQTKGNLLEIFEQNNAKFEYLINNRDEMDFRWLKVTTKNDKCFVIDSIEVGNQHHSSFEDWDKDGFKDRIYPLKWTYKVYLFDKTKNNFSREIKGNFNGEQWDFDKKLNLKFQFLEDKFGGVYQLYQLKDTTFKVISEIRITSREIEIRKNIVQTYEGMTYDTLPMNNKLFDMLQEEKNEDYNHWVNRTKKSIKTYWANNLSSFINKNR